MCTATGVSVSCANAQNGSSSGVGSSEPFGNAEITTPRWPRSRQRFISATVSSTPVVGRIAWPMRRPSEPSQNSASQSLYARTHATWSSGSEP